MSRRRRNRIGEVIGAKREILRSLTCFEDIGRRVISDDELSLIEGYIQVGHKAGFGLCRLKEIDVNAAVVGARGEFAGGTLIEFAVASGQDSIAHSLLRSGADPSFEAGSGAKVNGELVTHLWGLPSSYAVWLITVAVTSPRPGSLMCQLCDDGGRAAVVVLPKCGHSLCKGCYYRSVVLKADAVSDARCPLRECACSLEGYETARHPPLSATEAALEREVLEAERLLGVLGIGIGGGGADDTPHATAIAALDAIGQRSSLRFRCLAGISAESDAEPKEIDPSNSRKFRARSLRSLLRIELGLTAAQRSARLFAAASDGNVRRVLYLVAAGVDLETRNDYSHTCYFLASWKGHEQMAATLKALGASDAEDWTGTRPSHFPLVPSQETIDRFAPPVLTTLIPPGTDHPGAGSYIIDGGFSESLLERLGSLPDVQLPVVPASKPACSDRYYWADVRGEFVRAVADLLAAVRARQVCEGSQEPPLAVRGILPTMRFLAYRNAGGELPRHIDLCRSECFYSYKQDNERSVTRITSTHTFILYLSDCARGGETALLKKLAESSDENTLAAVQPKRGRLLFFPHACPHEGRRVESVPKVALRGEMYSSSS